MVFCLTYEPISFCGVITGIQDSHPDCPSFPFDLLMDFIDADGGKIVDWRLPWMGAKDPIFAVVCPD